MRLATIIRSAVAFILLIALTGCANVTSPTTGLITLVKAPVAVGIGKTASKTGEACANNILGVVAFGDASISTAKQAGSITEIASVDQRSTNILFIYSRYCTIAKGA